MKKHTKIWLQGKGLTGHEPYIPCEAVGCGKRVQDIHHITPKGMGGRKNADTYDNLVGLCREHHEQAHRDKSFNEELKIVQSNRKR